MNSKCLEEFIGGYGFKPWGPLPVETRITGPPPIFGWGGGGPTMILAPKI